MVTAYATFDTAISAWEKGAEGIIRKPFQNEQILALVARGIKKRRNEEERVTLRQAMTRSVSRDAIIGRSEKMENIFRLVERVAPARSTVLITGESGTGKELVAKAIHEASPRAEKSFCRRQLLKYSVRICSNPNFSDTQKAHLQARLLQKKGFLKLPTAVRYFSMRSAICVPKLKFGFCASYKNANLRRSAKRLW